MEASESEGAESMTTRIEIDQPGHFICADRCRFFRHTHVGKFCVSTIGELYLKPSDKSPSDIGYKRLYETMVFRMLDEQHHVANVDTAPANTRDAAKANHERLVATYAAEADRPDPQCSICARSVYVCQRDECADRLAACWEHACKLREAERDEARAEVEALLRERDEPT